MQATIRKSVTFSGVALHAGGTVTMTIRPAAADTGIRFCRIDVTDRDQIVPALYDRVVDTRLCTKVGNADGVTVSTIEHVMAALSAMGVDNALITLDGPEVPVMDGSAQPFVEAIEQVGLAFAAVPRAVLRVLEPVIVEHGAARAELHPADVFALDYDIDFPDPAIGRQTLAMTVTAAGFAEELADCRTFARLAEIEALRKVGLARGGDLGNAVVVDGDRVLNPGGLRRPDEFVRHKMLDAVGDLALAGMPVLGRYVGVRAGHDITNRLLHALFARPSAWRIETVETHPAVPPLAPAMAEAMRLAAE
jgi:UDP-3-O-[3-hydroxymyristoyl] N-acetylglucosamine deacetylase